LTTGPAALTVNGLAKAFAGVRALAGVDLEVGRGEIHALLGENGAGKSTLIKILAGVVEADSGEVSLAGEALRHGFGPADAERAGIRFVHQDLGLVDGLSVAENIAFLTGFDKKFGLISRQGTANAARRPLAALGSSVSPDSLVGDLPQAEKVVVALARAMAGNARLIVLDEVTASLPGPDVARLHRSIRVARERGIAFLYVTHRLDEVFELCDGMTILADGRNVATARTDGIDLASVVRLITGGDLHRRARSPSRSNPAPVRLTARGLAAHRIPGPVDLAVRGGEILGVTGIRGSAMTGSRAVLPASAGVWRACCTSTARQWT